MPIMQCFDFFFQIYLKFVQSLLETYPLERDMFIFFFFSWGGGMKVMGWLKNSCGDDFPPENSPRMASLIQFSSDNFQLWQNPLRQLVVPENLQLSWGWGDIVPVEIFTDGEYLAGNCSIARVGIVWMELFGNWGWVLEVTVLWNYCC